MAYITLLSDFGLQDASVAVAKGILMQHVPSAQIVDIAHEIIPFNVGQAAYMLGATYKNFPAGTAHIPLIDIFSEINPKLALVEYDSHYFLAPDNGIIPLALRNATVQAWLCLDFLKEHSFHRWLRVAGDMVSALQLKKPSDLGLTEFQLQRLSAAEMPSDGILEVEAIHIDLFGNVVVDFTRAQYDAMAKGRRIHVDFIGLEEIDGLKNNYNDVRRGYNLCRFNSNDYLEICVNRGKASQVHGLRLGSKYNEIKISFR